MCSRLELIDCVSWGWRLGGLFIRAGCEVAPAKPRPLVGQW